MNQTITLANGGLNHSSSATSGIKEFLLNSFSSFRNSVGIRRILPKENEAVKAFIQGAIKRKGGIGQDVLLYDGELGDLFGTYTTEKSFFHVLHLKNEILGTIGFRADKTSVNGCKIKKFYLNPEYNKEQYKSQMLQAACEKARSMKYSQIMIELEPREIELITFFEEQGFHKNIGSGTDLVRLESQL